MPTRGPQSTLDSATIEAAIQSACKELNAELKANPGCKSNIAAAARRHPAVNYTTLRNRFQGLTKPRKVSHAGQQRISPEQESVLVEWIEHLGITGHPVCKRTIKKRVEFLCGKKPSRGWVYRFLERHPEIVLSKPSGLDPKRARAFNRPSVQKYFNEFKNIVNNLCIPTENIYNMDEKGCQRGGGKKGTSRKYFYSRIARAKYKYRSANLELIMIIECISADGKDLWPGFVFEGHQYDPEWFETNHEIVYGPSSILTVMSFTNAAMLDW